MGRRSDHSREELREMIVHEGHRQMAEVGFAKFSAREVLLQASHKGFVRLGVGEQERGDAPRLLLKQAQLFEGYPQEFAQFRAEDGIRNMATAFPAAQRGRIGSIHASCARVLKSDERVAVENAQYHAHLLLPSEDSLYLFTL